MAYPAPVYFNPYTGMARSFSDAFRYHLDRARQAREMEARAAEARERGVREWVEVGLGMREQVRLEEQARREAELAVLEATRDIERHRAALAAEQARKASWDARRTAIQAEMREAGETPAEERFRDLQITLAEQAATGFAEKRAEAEALKQEIKQELAPTTNPTRARAWKEAQESPEKREKFFADYPEIAELFRKEMVADSVARGDSLRAEHMYREAQTAAGIDEPRPLFPDVRTQLRGAYPGLPEGELDALLSEVPGKSFDFYSTLIRQRMTE